MVYYFFTDMLRIPGNKRVLRSQRLSENHKKLHSCIEKAELKNVRNLIIDTHEVPCVQQGDNCFHVANAEDVRMQKVANKYTGITWDILKFLLETKPEGINSLGINRKTLLMSQVGNQDHFFYLLERGASLETASDDGTTVLHEASHEGAPLPVLGKILESGLDINVRDKDQETPLFKAIRQCKQDHFDFLCDRNCDLSAKNKVGNTPLHVVCDMHSISKPYYNQLEYEEQNKRRDHMFEKLLLAGVNINSTNQKGKTPLHLLAHREDTLHLMEKIIEKGADVNAIDIEGKTPLMRVFDIYKYQGGRGQAIRLVENGADVNIRDKKGKTALSMSIYDTGAFNYLMSKGANPLLQDGANKTVLYDAIKGLYHIPLHLGTRAPVDATVILKLLRSGCPLEDFYGSASNSCNHLKDDFFKLIKKCHAHHSFHNRDRVFAPLHKYISLCKKDHCLELLKLLKEKNYNFASHQNHCSILTVCLMKRLLQMLMSPPRYVDEIETITLAELKDVIIPIEPPLQQRIIKYLNKTSEKWAAHYEAPDALFIALQSGKYIFLSYTALRCSG
jgi:ankyrin repeat protein